MDSRDPETSQSPQESSRVSTAAEQAMDALKGSSLPECSRATPSAPRDLPSRSDRKLRPLPPRPTFGVEIVKKEESGSTPGHKYAAIASASLLEEVRRLIPEPPTVQDIAVGLSTELRWGGQTIVPWSVLHHVLAGLTQIDLSRPWARLQWMFHDAEEIYTGDIPSPFKTKQQRELADVIRDMIFDEILGFPFVESEITELDTILASAESAVLCTPTRAVKVNGGLRAPASLKFVIWDLARMDVRLGIDVFMEQFIACSRAVLLADSEPAHD